MKDMGGGDYILSFKIQRDRSKKFLSLSQKNLHKENNGTLLMNSCKSMYTLVPRGEIFNPLNVFKY